METFFGLVAIIATLVLTDNIATHVANDARITAALKRLKEAQHDR